MDNFESKHLQEIAALYDISLASESIGFDALIDMIVEKAALVMDAQACSLMVRDGKQDSLIIQAGFGLSEDIVKGTRIAFGEGIAGQVAQSGEPLLLTDVAEDKRLKRRVSKRSEVSGSMCVPLKDREGLVTGVLNIRRHFPKEPFNQDDLRLFSIFATHASLAFSNAQLYSSLHKRVIQMATLTSYTESILSSIDAAVVTLDPNGTIRTWNAAAESLTGIKSARIIGLDKEKAMRLLRIPASNKAILKDAVERVFNTSQTFQGFKIPFHPFHKDELILNISISLLKNKTGEILGFVLIFEDITSEIRMEDELRRMGELASIGQLAASIAHELRNPLSSIKGAAQFLMKEQKDAASKEFLGIIVDEVNGLNKLTTQFLDFARPLQMELSETNINESISKVTKLMQHVLNESKITIQLNLDEKNNYIQADSAQIEQVLKNILINSIQAMPKGGNIELETNFDGHGVKLLITDSGYGISEDKLEKIFQPFFTTKTKGTGLGLSVVKKIIGNHGGSIAIDSAYGEGVRVSIYLPYDRGKMLYGKEIDPTFERRVSGDLKGDIFGVDD